MLALLHIRPPRPAASICRRSRWGLSLGNSREFTGLRLNLSDHGVARVTGLNLTLWRPLENTLATTTAWACTSSAPTRASMRGLFVSLGGIGVREGAGVFVNGLGMGGGDIAGVTINGLGAGFDDLQRHRHRRPRRRRARTSTASASPGLAWAPRT